MTTSEIDDIETAVSQDYPAHDPARTATLDGFGDESRPTNGANAEAAAALVHGSLDWEDESAVADLITGLLHLAHSKGFDPGDIARSAIISFHAEAGPLDK